MATAELQRLMFLDSAATAEDDLPLQVSRGLRYVPDVKMFDDKQNALRKKRELHSMERWLNELKHPDSYLRAIWQIAELYNCYLQIAVPVAILAPVSCIAIR